jgi:hypothetical protein
MDLKLKLSGKFFLIIGFGLLLCISNISEAYVRCAGTNEVCPQVESLKYTDFPGVTDENGTGFSRNQDTYGACKRFADVDLVCYKLKQLGLWKSKSNCSVMDYQLWIYNKKRKEKGEKGTLDGLLTTDGKKIDPIDDSDIIEYAEKVGFCPEDRFRSEFPGNEFGAKDYFQKNLARDVNSKLSKARTEAQVNLPVFCPECTEMSPVLSKEQWNVVKDQLTKATGEDPKLAAFNKINELACPPSQRVKLPKGYAVVVPEGKTHDYLDYGLDRKEVFLVSIGGRTLDPSIKDSETFIQDHKAMIAGAECDQDPSKAEGVEHCYYIIKNSWGYNCRSVKDSENRKCDKASGAVLLTWEALRSGLDGGTWAGGITTLAKHEELKYSDTKGKINSRENTHPSHENLYQSPVETSVEEGWSSSNTLTIIGVLLLVIVGYCGVNYLKVKKE